MQWGKILEPQCGLICIPLIFHLKIDNLSRSKTRLDEAIMRSYIILVNDSGVTINYHLLTKTSMIK